MIFSRKYLFWSNKEPCKTKEHISLNTLLTYYQVRYKCYYLRSIPLFFKLHYAFSARTLIFNQHKWLLLLYLAYVFVPQDSYYKTCNSSCT